MARLSVRVRTSDVTVLRRHAEAQQMSLSRLVRVALRAYVVTLAERKCQTTALQHKDPPRMLPPSP